MGSETEKNLSLEEALKIINDAAEHNRDELERIVQEKYSYIQNLFKMAQETVQQKKEDVEAFFSGADQELHRNPWPFLVGALFVGFFMGSRK